MEQEQLTVYLPSQSDEGIYNGVYYTTDVVNIINEVTICLLYTSDAADE